MHVVVIGAYGSAGVAVASQLAEYDGVELTLADDGDPGGGLCILRGCMPSKEVLSAGAHRFQVRHDDRLSGVPEIDLESVVARKDEHISNFAAHRRAAVHDLAERENVEFIHEPARFVDNHTVRVDGRDIDADYVVVATGSTVNVPDLPGIEEVDYTTSAAVLDRTEFPDTGVVMGFGYVGIEMVPYLSEACGMDITVIEHDARPLDEADAAFGDELLSLYREEFGIDILTHTYEQSVEATEDGVRLNVEHDGREEAIDADELFLFTGRQPALDGIGLERTALDIEPARGAETIERATMQPEPGWVADTMQARDDPRIFVVGDANGKEPILHVAKEQGATAAKNILAHSRGDNLTEYENIHHHVMFAGLGVYPFARVGHSVETAEQANLDVVTATRQAADDGVFKTKDVPEGLARLVVDADDGTVVGYQGLHYHADVMAKTMQVIVERGMDVREIPDRAYHPTTPEILDGLVRETSVQLG
jgi:pyruvate/2-oxoglutarate dehydrogenase complex dihydrolipoamide dehydrogenase (E3) component